MKIREIKRYHLELDQAEFTALRQALSLVLRDYEPSETLEGLIRDLRIPPLLAEASVDADDEGEEAAPAESLPDKAIRVATSARSRRKGRLVPTQE